MSACSAIAVAEFGLALRLKIAKSSRSPLIPAGYQSMHNGPYRKQKSEVKMRFSKTTVWVCTVILLESLPSGLLAEEEREENVIRCENVWGYLRFPLDRTGQSVDIAPNGDSFHLQDGYLFVSRRGDGSPNVLEWRHAEVTGKYPPLPEPPTVDVGDPIPSDWLLVPEDRHGAYVQEGTRFYERPDLQWAAVDLPDNGYGQIDGLGPFECNAHKVHK